MANLLVTHDQAVGNRRAASYHPHLSITVAGELFIGTTRAAAVSGRAAVAARLQ